MIEQLARLLLAHAEKLAEEPFCGYNTEDSRLGEELARNSVCHLHLFLRIHPEALPNAADLIRATSSWEAWQDYGS